MAHRRQCRGTPAPTDDERWAAVIGRDRDFDDLFFYSVASTGVYCRPSCPSRTARRANVRFHSSPAEAEAAGFRPCKRCRPNEPTSTERDSARIAAACRAIESQDECPRLRDLAADTGLSPWHFHRLFKTHTGVTPRAYADARRRERLARVLAETPTITEAIYEAGFGSSAGFYASAPRVLGMTPRTYRAGGRATEIRYAIGRCYLGRILVAATTKGICAVLLGDDPESLVSDLERRFPDAALAHGGEAFERTLKAVVDYLDRPGDRHDLPLDIQGTAFQQRVWQTLTRIPQGSTASYAEIAEAVGDRSAVRAVAGACAANPVAVLIPCHRVVRSDGGLSGYRWGVERKRSLLERERKSPRRKSTK